MTHQYNVSGVTCGGCVANVKKAIESVAGVTIAVVQRESPQATVTMEQHIDRSAITRSRNCSQRTDPSRLPSPEKKKL
jgi:copper chaperone CopZ